MLELRWSPLSRQKSVFFQVYFHRPIASVLALPGSRIILDLMVTKRHVSFIFSNRPHKAFGSPTTDEVVYGYRTRSIPTA